MGSSALFRKRPTVWLVALIAKEKCEGEHFYE